MNADAAAATWRTLQFAPESFGPDLFALCRKVPALDHLLCRLDHIHDPTNPEDRVLRYYQRDLALHGCFELHLPDTSVVLRSGRSVMLADKTVFFGVRGRRDLMLAAARIGFALPLCSVVLPLHRAVINIRGPQWNVDSVAAQRALARFKAAGIDWGEPSLPDGLARAVVTGDASYAHHLWNQLGALDALLARCKRVSVLVTHQPIAPLREIFADHPGLTVTPTPAESLPRLDPREVLPFPAGGKVVMRGVRERILRVAERHATRGVRDFLARSRSRKLIWLSVRAQGRTAVNLFDALATLGETLLRDKNFGIVIDGYSRPNDYTTNRDYDRATSESAIARDQALAHMLVAELAKCVGAEAAERIFPAVGCDLLDSIHLAAQCRAYFVHHGTVQHKIGYFTTVPGMAHANPAVLAWDQAGGHRHVTEDPGVIEYIDRALVDDLPAPGGSRMHPNNAYRFNNISALVTVFRDFLARQGVL